MLLEIDHLKKVYHGISKRVEVEALKDINIEIKKGEYTAIMGESGSGKSTLLNIISTLDTATVGKIYLNGEDLTQIKEKDAAQFRREKLGFVFQDFNLLDNFSIKDNILLPLVLLRQDYQSMMQKLDKVVDNLKLSDLINKYPYELSGGQKQRVTIARAIINSPEILLADEPTGSLDSKTSKQMLDVFDSINESGQTILMVTHSPIAASRSKRVIFIKDGVVFHQIYRKNQSSVEFIEKINQAMTSILSN